MRCNSRNNFYFILYNGIHANYVNATVIETREELKVNQLLEETITKFTTKPNIRSQMETNERIASLQAANAKLQVQGAQLQTHVAQLQAEKLKLKEENLKLKEKNLKLQQRIADLEAPKNLHPFDLKQNLFANRD
jgi:predicted nuclease with TOPRIM domain